jgi:hypothetical protein
VMVKLLRHRQTKGAATDRLYLRPPRHISTLPSSASFDKSEIDMNVFMAVFSIDWGGCFRDEERAQRPSYKVEESAQFSDRGAGKRNPPIRWMGGCYGGEPRGSVRCGRSGCCMGLVDEVRDAMSGDRRESDVKQMTIVVLR